jgi:hypothetical protein
MTAAIASMIADAPIIGADWTVQPSELQRRFTMGTFAIIQLVLSIISAGAQGFAGIVQAAHQNGELTDAERDTLLAQGEAAFASPRWQSDAQRAAGSPPTTGG